MKQLAYIYGVFAIDSFLENFYRFVKLPDGLTPQQIYDANMDTWNVCCSFRVWLLWIVMLTVKFVLPFTKVQVAIIFLMLFFNIIDTADWYWNFNQRNDGMDWAVFGFINVILLFLWWKLRNTNLSINLGNKQDRK